MYYFIISFKFVLFVLFITHIKLCTIPVFQRSKFMDVTPSKALHFYLNDSNITYKVSTPTLGKSYPMWVWIIIATSQSSKRVIYMKIWPTPLVDY